MPVEIRSIRGTFAHEVLGAQLWTDIPSTDMEKIQIAYLNAALRRTDGKKSAAAALLRMDPQRMKYLCRKLKL